MRFLALSFIILPLAAAAPPSHRQLADSVYRYSFDAFCLDFYKRYTEPSQRAMRKELFQARLEEVRMHNAGNFSWKMGINEFSDMTGDELRAFKGLKRKAGSAGEENMLETDLGEIDEPSLPKSVDWRTKGVVTKPKDQGGCGSCWAFSSTEVLESHAAIATGKLLELSPQQLVSCAPNPKHCGGTGGCEGSTQPLAFAYVEAAGGLSLESDYPYEMVTGTCNENKVKPAVSITGYVELPTNKYKPLLEAVAQKGPVSISVAANWFSYEEGVFDNYDCGTTIDHAVTLDGYGEEDGKPYWLVRNSWGKRWGVNGYIKILRDSEPRCGTDTKPADGDGCDGGPATVEVCGVCGILSASSYPTGVSLSSKAAIL